ncbi:hypothetical protein V8G54_000693 [Vigna mungo]|uniref:Uncharacterized protein n=1 Tax=Vigna mungo TaxID=3915 RepID=A0AAQ3S7H7_VIGMU
MRIRKLEHLHPHPQPTVIFSRYFNGKCVKCISLTFKRYREKHAKKINNGMDDTEIFHVSRERREQSRFPQTAFQTYHSRVLTFQLKPNEKKVFTITYLFIFKTKKREREFRVWEGARV